MVEARDPGTPTRTRGTHQVAGERICQAHRGWAVVRSVRVVETKQDEVTEVQRGREDAVREIHPGRAAEARQVQVAEAQELQVAEAQVAQVAPAARRALGETVLGAQATAKGVQATPTTR